MEKLHIRKAEEKDLPVLRQFEQGVIAAERPFDPTLKNGEIHYYDLQGMLTDNDVALMVAEAGSELVASGYARIEKAKLYLQYTHHAYLGFMYVVPAYRGRGINRQIIDALATWALSKGVTELRLEVYSENEAAINAYRKTGFEGLLLQMRKELKK